MPPTLPRALQPRHADAEASERARTHRSNTEGATTATPTEVMAAASANPLPHTSAATAATSVCASVRRRTCVRARGKFACRRQRPAAVAHPDNGGMATGHRASLPHHEAA